MSRSLKLVLAILLLLSAALARLWVELRLAHWNDPPSALRIVRAEAARRINPGEIEPRVRRLVFLLLDGVRARDAPKLRGAFATVDAGFPSYSKPGYHRLWTGAPSWVTGVRSNRFAGRARLPTVLDTLRRAGWRATFVGDEVAWMAEMLGRPGDEVSTGWSTFSRDFDRALASDVEIVVAHPCVVDWVAHQEGRRSARYAKAIRLADRYAQRALRATDPGLDLVAIASDHGHMPRGGHGGDDPDVKSAFFFLRGRNIPEGVRTHGTLEQVAVTLSAALGVPPPAGAVAPPIKPFVPNVKEDAARRRRVLAQARAAIPEDRWPLRAAIAGTILAMALVITARRFGAMATLRETAIGCAPLAAYAAVHLAVLGGPSLSSIWLESEYTRWMAALGLVAYGVHAVATRSFHRALVAAVVSIAPLAASAVRLGAWMGSDFVDPGWWYVALTGVVPFAAGCAIAALALVLSAARRPDRTT